MQRRFAYEPRIVSCPAEPEHGDETTSFTRAVYELATAPGTMGDWLTETALAARPSLDRGYGVLTCAVRVEGGVVSVEELVLVGVPDAGLVAPRAAELAAVAARLELRPGGVSAVSEHLADPHAGQRLRAELEQWRGAGVVDHVLFSFSSERLPSVRILFIVPSAARCDPSDGERKRLERLASHFRSAFRLRLVTMLDSFALSGAELPRRRLLEELSRSPAREAADPEHALALWSALLDGAWSLLAHLDTGDSRLLLARRNAGDVRASAILTRRERKAAVLAVFGHSTKYIAFELGVAISTACTLVGSAIRKLGLRSRVELIEVFGLVSETLNFPASTSQSGISAHRLGVEGEDYVLFRIALRRLEPPACLTQAEREIVRGVLSEKSNAEIARARRTSVNTVANQLRAVYLKLGISGRSQLITSC